MTILGPIQGTQIIAILWDNFIKVSGVEGLKGGLKFERAIDRQIDRYINR